ncbi:MULTISPECIES: hypothetical protein [Streptomyces]|uniref:CopG family transcriptional regulator n=1 Tax=Streptomyces rubrogriseus TaxID=194673 RepID=A0A6G3TQP0_9ACTN|nr:MULTISPECIES: hypothetical protein [Streptomyces]NEC39047.1 hypothetical protein [Streptomyces rubrogriseus]QUI36310.1 hypothetical protein H9W91_35845 [Streptomyces alfalfae]
MAPRHNFETPDDVTEPPLTPNTGGVRVGADLVGRRPRKASDWKSFSSYLPEDLQRVFRSECMLAGIEVRQGLDEAVRAWLEARQAGKSAG